MYTSRISSKIARYFALFAIVVAASLGGVCELQAQPSYNTTSYTEANGLPMTEVEMITQDPDGFLWLATRAGLYKYDGHSFANYHYTQDKSHSRHFTNIIIDDLGTLWLLNRDHRLYHFSPKTESMQLYAEDVFQIYKLDGADICYCDTQANIYRCTLDYKRHTYSKERWLTPDMVDRRNASSQNINDIVKDSQGNIWLLSNNGLYRNRKRANERPAYCFIENDGRQFFGSSDGYLIEYAGEQEFILNTRIEGKLEFIQPIGTGSKGLIGSAAGGLNLLDFNEWSSKPIQSDSHLGGSIRSLSDKYGNIWIWSPGGSLNWFDQEQLKLTPFVNPQNQRNWDSEHFVSYVFLDRQDILWVSSSNNSLTKAVYNSGRFKLRKLDPNAPRESKANNVRSMLLTKSNLLYVATRDSLLHIYREGFREVACHKLPAVAYSMVEDPDGSIWIGTRGKGLLRYFPSNPIFNPRIYNKANSGSASNDYYRLNLHDPSRLWAASSDGIFFYDRSTSSFVNNLNGLNLSSDWNYRVRFIDYSHDGYLYASSTNGLFVCHGPNLPIGEMYFVQFPKVAGMDIYHILPSRNGQLWASSAGNGLLRFDGTDPNNGFFAYTTANGLLSNYTYSAYEDSESRIWVATNDGLNRLDPSNDHIIGFSFSSMGFDTKIEEGAPILGWNGELYYNTTQGILSFNPNEVAGSTFIPKMTLVSCIVAGASVDVEDNIVRAPADASIRVSYAAVDMTAPERVMYSYQIDGGEWIDNGNNTRVILRDLRVGRHTFKLRSTNGDGQQANNELTLSLRIRRKLSTAAIVGLWLLSLLALGLGATIVDRRIKRNQTTPEAAQLPLSEEQKFEKELTSFLKDNLDNGQLQISDICEHFMVSKATLLDKCKKSIGKTPIEYLRELRFQQAAGLILSSDMALSQIAYMTGFNDSHYFSNSFKARFGVTPSEYRKRGPIGMSSK